MRLSVLIQPQISRHRHGEHTSLDTTLEHTGVGGTAGIGDKGINLAKLLDHLVDQRLYAVVVADVELVGLDLDAVRLCQLLGVLLSALRTRRVGDGHIGAHLGTTARGLDAHSPVAGSAGDDDDLALEREEVQEGRGFGDGLNHVGGGCVRVCGGGVVIGAATEAMAGYGEVIRPEGYGRIEDGYEVFDEGGERAGGVEVFKGAVCVCICVCAGQWGASPCSCTAGQVRSGSGADAGGGGGGEGSKVSGHEQQHEPEQGHELDLDLDLELDLELSHSIVTTQCLGPSPLCVLEPVRQLQLPLTLPLTLIGDGKGNEWQCHGGARARGEAIPGRSMVFCMAWTAVPQSSVTSHRPRRHRPARELGEGRGELVLPYCTGRVELR